MEDNQKNGDDMNDHATAASREGGARRQESTKVLVQEQLQLLLPTLLRFAKLQLRDEAAAEDAVSETLLAVMENPDAFTGKSSLKTYVIGILKFKLIDQIRRQQRNVSLGSGDEGEQTHEQLLDELFDRHGHYVSVPPGWATPDGALEQKQFFDVLQTCIDVLPDKLARLFMMREWLELDMEHIGEQEGINQNHLGVLLFRARLRLRECLQIKWFGSHPVPGQVQAKQVRRPRAVQ